MIAFWEGRLPATGETALDVGRCSEDAMSELNRARTEALEEVG